MQMDLERMDGGEWESNADGSSPNIFLALSPVSLLLADTFMHIFDLLLAVPASATTFSMSFKMSLRLTEHS